MRDTRSSTSWLDDPLPNEPLSLRRVPLLWAGLSFAFGTLLAREWQTAFFLLVSAIFAVAVLGIACFRAARLSLLPVFALWCVAGLWCAQIQPSPPSQQALLSYADGLAREVSGSVTRVRALPPETTRIMSAGESPAAQPWRLEEGQWEEPSGPGATSVDVALDHVEDLTPDVSTMHAIGGGVRITVLGAIPELVCGDRLFLSARLRAPERYRDLGAWSHADALLAEGIGATAIVQSSALHVIHAAKPTLRCRLFTAQAWAVQRIATFQSSAANEHLAPTLRLTQEDAGTLDAMLFGDRTGLRRDLRQGFERTGTFHLFVISGLHVALLGALLYELLRRIRLRAWPATFTTIILTAAYAALTGWGTPVVRALLMLSVFLIARACSRSVTALQALGAAALAVLIASPRALQDASFQMTFLAIVAVAGIAAPLIERTVGPWIRASRDLQNRRLDAHLYPRHAQMRVTLRMFADALGGGRLAMYLPAVVLRLLLPAVALLLLAVVTEACMALPMAVIFHRATPLALPANLLILPLLTVLLPLAILTFGAALFSAKIALVPSVALAIALHAAEYTIARIGHHSVAEVRVPAPLPACIIAALMCAAIACLTMRLRSRRFMAASLFATALIPIFSLWPSAPLLHPHLLELTAIDVGQGDSLLLVTPDGHTALVDAGGPVGMPASAAEHWDVGEEVVAPFLWSRRIRRLDAVILTHAHSDHMGGMPAVLRDFRPRELWLSVDPGSSTDFRALLAEAATLNIPVRHFNADTRFDWYGLTATVLSPADNYANPGAPRNDDSLVLRFAYQNASLLLEGDAEHASEETMLAEHRVSPVTLLKVGHHGSKTSTDAEFLAATAPRDAVISVGAHNTFGHPRPEVLARLEQQRVRTFRTDRNGAVTFLLRADGTITTQVSAP